MPLLLTALEDTAMIACVETGGKGSVRTWYYKLYFVRLH